MKKIAVTAGTLSACGMLVLLLSLGGCSNEGIFEPAEQPERHVYSAQFIKDLVLVDIDADVIIAVPAARELQVIDDPWIGGLVLSLLPGEARERFYARGVVFVDDPSIAREIVTVAGMPGSDVSEGVWLGSTIPLPWFCIKCGLLDPPCCTPWPDCCSDDKDRRHKDIFELQ